MTDHARPGYPLSAARQHAAVPVDPRRAGGAGRSRDCPALDAVRENQARASGHPFVEEDFSPSLPGATMSRRPVPRRSARAKWMPQPAPTRRRAVGDDLLGEALAGPLEVVDAEVVLLAGVVAAVGAVALAGDQLGLAVAVDVGPDQVVVLGVERVDGVVDPGALAGRGCSARTSPGRSCGARPTISPLSPSPFTSATRMGTLGVPAAESNSSLKIHLPSAAAGPRASPWRGRSRPRRRRRRRRSRGRGPGGWSQITCSRELARALAGGVADELVRPAAVRRACWARSPIARRRRCPRRGWSRRCRTLAMTCSGHSASPARPGFCRQRSVSPHQPPVTKSGQPSPSMSMAMVEKSS